MPLRSVSTPVPADNSRPGIDVTILWPFGGGPVAGDGTFYFGARATKGDMDEDWGKDEIYPVVSIGNFSFTTEYKPNTVSGYY